MGKHDSDEEYGFFLGGVELIKNIAIGIIKNLKSILIIALIPIIGFGAYYLTKYLSNNKNKKTEPTYAVVGNIVSNKKEYLGGYEVLGEIKIPNIGVDVKVLNPELNGEKYIEDSLKNGAIFYYGEGLNELGNTVILGHNSSDSFLD